MDERYLDFYSGLSDEGKKVFDKLPEERKELAYIVVEKINKGGLHWEKGWIGGEMYNPVTNIHYKGINAMFLSFRAEVRSYSDSRWVTFNQMTQKGWSFKKDENGNSLGKGAGTPVEYFTFYDKLTKKPIDWKAFKKLSKEDQTKYWKDNIRTLLRTYTVFNCSLMDGVPELKMTKEIKAELNDKAETIIRNSAAPVNYDGHDRAYYRPSTDSIHLPQREMFVSYEEFLGTALHEIGHSTGHPSRLNRDLGDTFGGERYASEELNAEIFSLFEQQALDVKLTDSQIDNHSAYLESWGKEIRNNPNYLFIAISNAQKMVTYVNENYLGMSAASEENDELLAEEIQNMALASENVNEQQAPAEGAVTREILNRDLLWLAHFENGSRITGSHDELNQVIKSFENENVGLKNYEELEIERQPAHLQQFLKDFYAFSENVVGFYTFPEYFDYLENPNSLLSKITRDTVCCANFDRAEKKYGTLSEMNQLGREDNELRSSGRYSYGFRSTEVAEAEYQPKELQDFYKLYFDFGKNNNGISQTPRDFYKEVYSQNIDVLTKKLADTIQNNNKIFDLEKNKQIDFDKFADSINIEDKYSVYTATCKIAKIVRDEQRLIEDFNYHYELVKNTDSTLFLRTKQTQWAEGGAELKVVSADVDFSKLSDAQIQKYCVLWNDERPRSRYDNNEAADKTDVTFIKLFPEAARPILKCQRGDTLEGKTLIEAIEKHNSYAFFDADKLDENKVFNRLSEPTTKAMAERTKQIEHDIIYLADREYMPRLNILWSENNYLEEASYDLNYGNSLLNITNEVLQKNHPHSGYDKTDFQILFKRPGETVFDYRGRYDVGCESGDVIDHIEENAKYYMEHPEFTGESREELQKVYEPIVKSIKYLREAAQWGYQPQQGLNTLAAINQKIEDMRCTDDEIDGWSMNDSDQMQVLFAMRDCAMQEAYSPAMIEQMQGMKPRSFNELGEKSAISKNTSVND